jgi:hypothetical protein
LTSREWEPTPERLADWASRYAYSYDEMLLGDPDPRMPHAGDAIRTRGYLTPGELYQIARWKSPRKAKLTQQNPPDFVEAVSRTALRFMEYPQHAMRLLVALDGVAGATASTVLTVVDPKNFGVVDIRAWQVLSRWDSQRFRWKDQGVFSAIEFGLYLDTIRKLARQANMTCREVDMALWMWGGLFDGID